MIKLSRTETIELPSWKEFKKTKLTFPKIECFNFYANDKEYRLSRDNKKLVIFEFGVIPNKGNIFETEYSKQGYQQAIEKICEVGDFERV